MAEQFWKEGQQRVNGEAGKQVEAEVDITYMPNNTDALKSLSRAFLFYRYALLPRLYLCRTSDLL